MCVPSRTNPSNIQRFTANSIEAVLATIHVPNVGSIQIAVVYRSPSVPQTTVTTVLSRLLTHLSMCNTLYLVLGDFNDDLLHNQNSPTLRLMTNFNFKQFVQSATTAQGTLIDHVYYRNPYLSSEVHDTYYFDHDTVYYSGREGSSIARCDKCVMEHCNGTLQWNTELTVNGRSQWKPAAMLGVGVEQRHLRRKHLRSYECACVLTRVYNTNAHACYSDRMRDLQSVRVRMRMEYILLGYTILCHGGMAPVHVADTRIIFLWRTLYVSCVCVLCMNTVPARKGSVMNEL